MATKNNIRSIRFSDELAELIDRQIGDTFTQKFENLVTKCVWELPNREKQLKDIAAWEKGSNENHNRMIRRFFPKGTNFDKVKHSEVKAVQDWMNNYPRKILGWKRPSEIA